MKITGNRRNLLSIPMASMADVAFLLLIFLILTSALNLNEETRIVTPVSDQAKPVENERAFTIIVDREGDIFCQGQSVNGTELRRMTLREITGFPNTVFFIKGDENTEYEKIDAVLDTLKKNNIRNAVITAERPKQTD
jgi:biopolymer transport protein ExbD